MNAASTPPSSERIARATVVFPDPEPPTRPMMRGREGIGAIYRGLGPAIRPHPPAPSPLRERGSAPYLTTDAAPRHPSPHRPRRPRGDAGDPVGHDPVELVYRSRLPCGGPRRRLRQELAERR